MDSHMCFEHSMQKNNTKEIEKIKFVQILPHVWVDLDMDGEHLDIIRINNKNPENQRFYTLRVILSEPFYNFIYWDNEFHAVSRIRTSDLGRVWISSKCTQQHENM